jgi:signal transduction histidine kinase
LSASEVENVPAALRRRTLRSLSAVLGLALGLPALLFALVAWQAYREAFDAAEARMQNHARVAAEHTLRVLETTQALLARALDIVGNGDDASVLAREQEIHAQLARMTAPLPHLQSMWVFNASGRPLVSNRFFPAPKGLDISDREFFQWHRAGTSDVFVTEALVARVTGERFFDVSRRRVHADGSFAGLVSVGLYPERLGAFYGELAGGEPGIVVALLRRDGRYVARWPQLLPPGAQLPANVPPLTLWGQGQTSGTIRLRSNVDGSERLGAFRAVGDYPLYVTAGMPRDAVIAAWLRDMALLAAFTFPIAIALAWIAWVARRRAQLQFEASARLEAEVVQRRRAEDALLQSQKLEAVGRLTGGVAHDFNNLLAVVNNNAYLLRLRPDDPAARARALAAIERAVASGTQLTRQLLSFARRQPLHPQVVSLQERLPSLLALVKPVLGAGVAVHCAVADDTPTIRIDPAELELALLNLAMNARDAMPRGGRLDIEAGTLPADDPDALGVPTAQIRVSDSGTGIAPEVLDKVFDPFFTTKPVGEGTGLGLSQVYGLCKRSGGSARIESRPGAGTTVRLQFPASADGPVAADARPHEPVQQTLQARVLLVEDNAELANALQPVLESAGCEVVRVDSAQAAQARLDRGLAPDIVLSDIAMPGPRDGIALAEELRRSHPALPIVLMTGYAEDLARAEQQNFVVLAKPCAPALLVRTLARALQAHPAATA